MKKQNTNRTVPVVIDNAVRRRPNEKPKNLKAVSAEPHVRGLEFDARQVEHTDLDDLIGTYQEDAAFDQAMTEFKKTIE